MKKIKDYFLYAIGEIILVMLGILFALQINNWNETRKTKNLAQEYFKGVELDLKRDTAVFNQAITFIKNGIEYSIDALNSNQLDTMSADYLVNMCNGFYFNLKINDATFLNMRNSNLESVKDNRKTYNLINHYYIFKQDYLNNFSEWEVENAKKESTFWAKQTSIEMSYSPINGDTISNFQDEVTRTERIIDVLNSTEGRNLRKSGLMRLQGTLGRYEGVIEAATDLLKELNKRKKKTAKK